MRQVVLIIRSCFLIIASILPIFSQTPTMRLDASSDTRNSADRYTATAILTSDELPVPKRSARENEAAVIDVCASYVEGEMIYFYSIRDTQGSGGFANTINSTPGAHDGLYWPMDSWEDESPIGPRFAAAAFTELQPGGSRPYFGYYFKILYAQGPDAVGGARDYRVDGRLATGFALIAWPAEYGVSGVDSFLVNHLGDVYSKDLGPDTDRAALGMSAFSPDHTWTKVLARAANE